MALDLTKLVSGIEVVRQKSNIVVNAIFYITDINDLTDYQLQYGDDVTETFEGYLNSDEYNTIKVQNCKITEILYGQQVPARVELVSTNKLSGIVGFDNTGTGYGDIIIKKFGFAEVRMDSSWFGVRKATTIDANNSILSFDTGTDCNSGDWIFNTATSIEEGTATVTRSPITNWDTAGSLPDGDEVKKILNQKYSVRTYTVKYYSSKKMSNISKLEGVNGTFPSQLRPPDDVTAGYWKSLGDLMETVYDKDGREWTEVIRRTIKAPKVGTHQYKWDSSKLGGPWSWE